MPLSMLLSVCEKNVSNTFLAPLPFGAPWEKMDRFPSRLGGHLLLLLVLLAMAPGACRFPALARKRQCRHFLCCKEGQGSQFADSLSIKAFFQIGEEGAQYEPMWLHECVI